MSKQRNPITTTIPVSLQQVSSGDDAGMPAVTLYYDDSVVFTLAEDAAAKYVFSHGNPIGWLNGDKEKKNAVTLDRTDAALTVTLKPNTSTWNNGKAVLHFDAKPGVDQPPPLDPIVDNGGVPH